MSSKKITTEIKADALDVALQKYAKFTKTGITYSPSTPFEAWVTIHGFLVEHRDLGQWAIGDGINFAEAAYGEKYAQFVSNARGRDYSTLTTMASVAARFEPSRRIEGLPFAYHTEVAYLPPQTADEILGNAIRRGWDRDDVRDAVAKAQGKPTKAEREAKPLKGKVKQSKRSKSAPLDGHISVTPAPARPAASPAAPEPKKDAEPPVESAEGAAIEYLDALGILLPKIDFAGMKPLHKKTWLKRFAPIDAVIDILTK